MDCPLNALAFLHRWLGVGGAALFVLWFASGIVMMYVRMPELAPADWLARARPIDPARLRVGAGEAAAAAQAPPGGLALAVTGATPGWRRVRRLWAPPQRRATPRSAPGARPRAESHQP